MSTQLSTKGGDHRWPQKADAAKKGSGSHHNRVRAKHDASRVRPRRVSNLSPTQLDRKRKNDRESQRAIRQRTKEQIERLEQQIRELEGEVGLLRMTMAVGVNTANMQWPIDIDCNTTDLEGAGDIYSVSGEDGEGGYVSRSFAHNIAAFMGTS